MTNNGIYVIIICTTYLERRNGAMMYKIEILLAGYLLTGETRFLDCAKKFAEELPLADSEKANQLISQAVATKKEKVG